MASELNSRIGRLEGINGNLSKKIKKLQDKPGHEQEVTEATDEREQNNILLKNLYKLVQLGRKKYNESGENVRTAYGRYPFRSNEEE